MQINIIEIPESLLSFFLLSLSFDRQTAHWKIRVLRLIPIGDKSFMINLICYFYICWNNQGYTLRNNDTFVNDFSCTTLNTQLLKISNEIQQSVIVYIYLFWITAERKQLGFFISGIWLNSRHKVSKLLFSKTCF